MLLSEGIGGQTFWLAEFPMSHKPNNEIRAECLHKTESSVSVGWFPRVFVCSPTNSNGRLNRSWESSLTLLSFSLRFPTDKSRTLFFALLVRLLLWISTNTRAVNHSEMPIKKCKPLFHFLESAVFRRNGKCNGGFCGFWAREEILSVIDSVGYFARAPSFESAFLKRSQGKRMSDNCCAIFQLNFAFGKYLTWNSFTEEIVNEWKSKRTKLWNYISCLMPL